MSTSVFPLSLSTRGSKERPRFLGRLDWAAAHEASFWERRRGFQRQLKKMRTEWDMSRDFSPIMSAIVQPKNFVLLTFQPWVWWHHIHPEKKFMKAPLVDECWWNISAKLTDFHRSHRSAVTGLGDSSQSLLPWEYLVGIPEIAPLLPSYVILGKSHDTHLRLPISPLYLNNESRGSKGTSWLLFQGSKFLKICFIL